MLVVVLARVHVEEDAAELDCPGAGRRSRRLRLGPAHHVEHLHARVPDLRVGDRLVLHVVDEARDVEQARERLLVREVAADLGGVDGVRALLDLILEPRLLPVTDGRRLRIELLQLREELGVVLLRALRGELRHALDERGRGLATLEHLVVGLVVRPVLEPEELRLLVAQDEELLQHGLVVRVTAAAEQLVDVLPRGVVVRVRDERDVVRIVRRDADHALRVGLVRGDVVRGQALEALGIRQLEVARVARDVRRVLLAELRRLVVNLLDARALRVVELDTRAAEVAQRDRLEPLRLRVGLRDVDRLDRVVHALVEEQVAEEGLHLLLARDARVAHGLVGVHLVREPRHVRGVVGEAHELVERLERLRRRHRRDERLRLLERRATLGEERGVLGGAGRGRCRDRPLLRLHADGLGGRGERRIDGRRRRRRGGLGAAACGDEEDESERGLHGVHHTEQVLAGFMGVPGAHENAWANSRRLRRDP